jgi:magnesium transporter
MHRDADEREDARTIEPLLEQMDVGMPPDREEVRSISVLSLPRPQHPEPGTAPGLTLAQLAEMGSGSQRVYVSCIDYSPEQFRAVSIIDIEDFLIHHRPEWSKVRWINVDGVTDMNVVMAIAEKYQLHPLAIEDMVHTGTRPKVEPYPAEAGSPPRLFIVARMIELLHGSIHCEQVSIFLGRNTVLTFQESHGDVWDPIRERICKAGTKLRQNDAGFLVYALLDSLVDHCFPILDNIGDRIESLEEQLEANPTPGVFHSIHSLKHDLLLLRRQAAPMRELIQALQRTEHAYLSETTRLYLRDVYDHTVQVIELLETYREYAIGLTETYMNAISNRANQVMKVLTMVATIFIPLTFIVGIWGMNFEVMPEMHNAYAYPWVYPMGFWTLCISVAGGLLWYFRRQRWL